MYMVRKFFFLILFILVPIFLFSKELAFFATCSVYLPEGWKVLGNKPDKVTFTDPTQNAYLQIKEYPGNTYTTAGSMYKAVLSKLKAQGEGDAFKYDTRDSWFGNIEFKASGYHYKGFIACINGWEKDYVILSFSIDSKFNMFHDFILSAMDSFAPDDSGRLSPGVVSQYYWPVPGPDKSIGYLHIDDKKYLFTYDKHELEASQVVVEREARILVTYTRSKLINAAWTRYYRILYRDNYLRLSKIAGILREHLAINYSSRPDLEKSALLLSWVQGYTYYRTGTLSDFLSPVTCLVQEKGDCDSRALLYVILLKHYGIDAILMVSSVYSHSMAGVAVDGKGARFVLNKVPYLVAETTDQVSIGLIDKKMADPTKWLGISFP